MLAPAANRTLVSSRRYQAVLAICSDLDETASAEVYFELLKFLNTTQETSMGQGVGLEVGNTIYFDMPSGHFCYWNCGEADREKIRALIRSGHIDCLHSYGDLATTRGHAARALEELSRYDCKIKVWIDHAQAPSNFGSDIMSGHGDERDHPVYHADLTRQYGIEYIWRGRVTSVIGQNCSPSLGGIWDAEHPLESAKTLAKEAIKQTLGRGFSVKYAMHPRNSILSPGQFRDGAPTVEFLRCSPFYGGVSGADRGDRVHQALTRRFFDRLVERNGACIFYTHLGKLNQGPQQDRLPAAAVTAFRLLAEYSDSGRILVTTTRRLLDLVAQAPNGWPQVGQCKKLRFPDV